MRRSGRGGVGGRATDRSRVAERVSRTGEPRLGAGADTGLVEALARERGATAKCGFGCEDVEAGGLRMGTAAEAGGLRVGIAAEAETGLTLAAFLGDARDAGLRGEAALFGVVGALAAAFDGDAGGRPLRDGGALVGEEARTSALTLAPALRAREPGFFCMSVGGSGSFS